MKVLIFNGALEQRTLSTSHTIANFLADELRTAGIEPTTFHLAAAGIPFLDVTLRKTPHAVSVMSTIFREADVHIWLTPLYHGGMTGAMKNCLDWLEVSAKEQDPYLSNKVIGLICWADGGKAMLGIQAMDTVARSLRAWVHPYSVPIVKNELYELEYISLSELYQAKLCKMISLLLRPK